MQYLFMIFVRPDESPMRLKRKVLQADVVVISAGQGYLQLNLRVVSMI